MTSSVSQTASLFGNNPKPLVGSTVAVALAAWLAVVLILGASGAYLGVPGQPPLGIFVGAVVPLILFAVAMRVSQAFREFALALDLRLIVAIQAWRYAGFGFIALYVNHVLPGLFAWPAGLGDMAIGMVAPLWIVALIRSPEVAASARFRLWNALGILDFVIAFTTATICAMTITDAGATSIAPMGQLPLVLVPEFMVPLFMMLHIIALMKKQN
jgi:hypothetical protein